jgi:hypothetical protein
MSKMINRHKYQNAEKNKNGDKIPLKKKRSAQIMENSVTDWQPEIDPNAITTMLEKQQLMIETNMSDDAIQNYMNDCFSLIQKMLTNIKNIPT